VASERLSGDPVWLLLISGAGTAKTETVQASCGAGALVISTIASEGALLSATKARDKVAATGGLLRKIGERGVLTIKDFTSILSADRNVRATVLAALREIYDGHWSRNVGSEGGQTLEWRGRLVVIGAVTTAWDAAHAVIAAMGDRFVLLRINSHVGRLACGKQAICNTGSEDVMRAELAAAIGDLVTQAAIGDLQLSEQEQENLLRAADLVTLVRTPVERDFRGDVIDAHAPEMPTRFTKQLAQIVRGGIAIGMTRERAMRLALRCARDSIPPLRLEILINVAAGPSSTNDVSKRLNRPWTTVKRELDALTVLGIVERADKDWRISESFDRATLLAMAVTGNVSR